jgi:hypothetical protein
MQLGVEAPGVMAINEAAAERRLTLIRDPNEVRKDLALPLANGNSSPIANPIRTPARIALYKSWTGNIDEGWTRFVFDTFNVPYTSLTDNAVKQDDLGAKYDVIVLPSQRAREITDGNAANNYPVEFTGGITAAGVTKLKEYVAAGGTLVCFDASCELLIKQFKLPLRNVLDGLKSSDFYCPGSILALEVETNQPLARGLGATADAYFVNSSAFEATDSSVRVIARYARENVLRSGWLLGEEKLRGKIALAEVPLGKGRVVLFGFRPQHRGQTWARSRSFGMPWASPGTDRSTKSKNLNFSPKLEVSSPPDAEGTAPSRRPR